MDERIKSLTILGEKPDEVRKITHNKTEFYFWYYMDGNKIKQKCEENLNLKDMTIAEAIEYFQIKIGE